ncbi:lipoprotein signal peptidase [Deltaproteobacteria bacterium]|nr:lipoprotein signal peptidase [Deltaproteobacteria bacterium]
MRKRYILIAAVAVLVLILDQVSKAWVVATLPEYTQIPVIKGFFNFVHVHNKGAAFGFLNRGDITWQFWLFLAATVIAAIVIIMLAKNASSREYNFFFSLGLILGGAAGNLIDRIRYREVIDFLDFYWRNYHWPAFNIADIAICCGAFLALILSWRHTRRGA